MLKNEVGQINEALAKVLCHNLTVAYDINRVGGERAEVYCQKCGTFETSVQKLKLFRR